MAIKYYMDVHVPYAVTMGLRMRGVDVLTAQEDESTRLSDSELLDRATQLNRILVSFDDDLLSEGVSRQRSSNPFSGIIYGHQLKITVGSCVSDLELIAKVAEPVDLKNRIEYLAL